MNLVAKLHSIGGAAKGYTCAILWNNVENLPVLGQCSCLYSKQPKLGLTQEFVVDCAHALWLVHTTKRLVSLMLLKGFLSDSFIYFMYRMLDENF